MLGAALPRPDRARHDAACELALVCDRPAFDALEADWNDLFRRAGRGTQVFQTFNWNWHWCNHFLAEPAQGSTPALAIVTARRTGRLVLVWPLVSERTAGLRQLSWMGEPVSQYGDVLVEDGPDTMAILREAWNFLARELAPDIVRLRRVRADAVVAPLLAELGAMPTSRLEAPYLDLASAADFAAYEQRYSPRSRRNRKRLARRLAERGTMAFVRHKEGPEARALAAQAIAMKRTWLKDRGLVSPALSDRRMAQFFADVAEGTDHPAGCQIAALISNGEPAAIEITLRCKDHTVMHVIVFNLAFEKAGAGVLLLEETIAQSFGSGCRTFDLLAPADSYKLDWADGATGVSDWALPLSLRGRAFAHLYLGFGREALKRVVGALPLSVRRMLAARLA